MAQGAARRSRRTDTRQIPAADLSDSAGGNMGRYPCCTCRGEREVRGGIDAEAARCALWCRATEGRMVEVEGHALYCRRGARLCAGGERAQGIAAYRLHLRRLARRCARP